jgi:hypothetical protein
LELGGRVPEQRKIVTVVHATNLFAAVSLAIDFKNGADKQFCGSSSIANRTASAAKANRLYTSR